MTANEPRVSDEDRSALVQLLSQHYIDIERVEHDDENRIFCMCGAELTGWSWHAHTADFLVSHGWGPRPAVSANQCHCPENGLVERDICGSGHCRSCHACDCDAKPTVSRTELEALMSATVNDLAEYLRTQVGIEVTE